MNDARYVTSTATKDRKSYFLGSSISISTLVFAGGLAVGCSTDANVSPSEEMEAIVKKGGTCAANDLECQTNAAWVARRSQIEARSGQASISIDPVDTYAEPDYLWFVYYDYSVNRRFGMEFEGSGDSNRITVRRWVCDGTPFQGYSLGCVKFSENTLNGSNVSAWADANGLGQKLGRTVTGDLALNLDAAARAAFYDPSMSGARKAFFGIDTIVDPMKAGALCNAQCAGENAEHTVAVGLIFLIACSFPGVDAVSCGVAGFGFGVFGGKSQTFCYSNCISCYQSMRNDCSTNPANAGCVVETPFKCGSSGQVLVKGVAGSDR